MEIRLEADSAGNGSAASLSVGDRLGRFEILGSLGAGAMGDVYRARDTKLQREVAIKVLPIAFSRDPDRQRRFEREARAAASLNHPNIVAVHDAGVHDGLPFIVTELLEGDTLGRRMNGRPVPVREAVDYAMQIARGLLAGHARGIVHRDIKPENLFVTKDGRVKILDFGLAKMIGPDSSPDATITLDGATFPRVVGTAAYMSPEQARGLQTDARSDVFSLGIVMYEMLAGFGPFRRATAGETMGAILHDEPPELTSVAAVPAPLERIVRHCLAKTPEERFQSVRDLLFDLEGLAASRWTAHRRSLPRRLSRQARSFALVFFVVAVAGTIGYRIGRRTTVAAPAASTIATTVRRLTEIPGIAEFPAISPDGRQLAFTAGVNGRRQILVRLLAGGSPVRVTDDASDHEFPRWSPDATSLLYFSPAGSNQVQGAIWSIPALGGSPRRVIDSTGDGDVSRTGRLVCFRLADRDVQLVTSALDGSDVRVVLRASAGYHLHPRWSADAQWIAFQEGDGLRFDVFVVPATGGEPRKLTNERDIIKGLAWLPDGSGLVYGSSRGSTVPYLPPLALWELRLEGGRLRQLTSNDAWYEDPDVHGTGVISAAHMQMRFDVWKFPFERAPVENVRRARQVTRQTGQVLTPTEAPGGSEVAFLSDSGGHGNLWVMSTRSEQLRQITFESDPAVTVGVPVWSPDGRSIAFVSSRGRTGFDFGIWLVNPDGGNLRNIVPVGLGPAWSPDGAWLYFADTSAGSLKKIPVTGGSPTAVRSEPTRNVIGVHNHSIYYMVERPLVDGRPEFEIRAATPESA